MPKLKKINVVFIYVSDLDKARSFYEQTLGFGEPILINPTWVEYALEEGSHFALHKTDPRRFAGAPQGANRMKLSIVVDDLKVAHDELKARGVKIDCPLEKGYGFEFIEFEDPEGNPLRLLQYTK
jgi:catechol 2,3-dioxygenase-like lactoylglutathione lyase family enzyme